MKIQPPRDVYEVIAFAVDFVLPALGALALAFILWSLYLAWYFSGF